MRMVRQIELLVSWVRLPSESTVFCLHYNAVVLNLMCIGYMYIHTYIHIYIYAFVGKEKNMYQFLLTHPPITKAIRLFPTLFAQHASTLNWVSTSDAFLILKKFILVRYKH
jgi:hypothetical protein